MRKFIRTYGVWEFVCQFISVICSCFLALHYSIITFNLPLIILWGVVTILWIVICIRNVRKTIKTLNSETEN